MQPGRELDALIAEKVFGVKASLCICVEPKIYDVLTIYFFNRGFNFIYFEVRLGGDSIINIVNSVRRTVLINIDRGHDARGLND